MTKNHAECRGEVRLVSAILAAAIWDAKHCVIDPIKAQARRFVSINNKAFVKYCWMIDLDPEWVARKAWDGIRSEDQSAIPKKQKRNNHIG